MRYILSIFTLVFILSACKEKGNQTENASTTSPSNVKISLAEWSYHKALFGKQMTNLQFAAKAKELGFTGIEYVNAFFKDKAENIAYLDSLNAAAKAAGVTQVLIMIDGEGDLGSTDDLKRDTAVNNHKKWVLAAKHLGCHSIRVNAAGKGTDKEVGDAAVKGLSALADFAAPHGINVIVENHGGYSSNGKWLADVMKRVNKSNCGTLPDFGNFCIRRNKEDDWNSGCAEEYDRYMGIAELMPYAKGVSAKSNVFNAEGDEAKMDYYKLFDIVKKSGYNGFVGVEYEGETDETEGIVKTKKLIEKIYMPAK